MSYISNHLMWLVSLLRQNKQQKTEIALAILRPASQQRGAVAHPIHASFHLALSP